MNDQKYYFDRDVESNAIGAVIDKLSRYDKNLFTKLHVYEEDREELAAEMGVHRELIEEMEERIFKKLQPLVTLVLGKEFEFDDVLNDVEKDFVISTFRTEIHFREDRANYMKTRGLSHVPA